VVSTLKSCGNKKEEKVDKDLELALLVIASSSLIFALLAWAADRALRRWYTLGIVLVLDSICLGALISYPGLPWWAVPDFLVGFILLLVVSLDDRNVFQKIKDKFFRKEV